LKIKCAVIGASGYTGIELLKILLNHPVFEINLLGGNSEFDIQDEYFAFKKVGEFKIRKTKAKEIAPWVELVFLSLPHKASMDFARELLEEGVKVVDLSADYRLKKENYEKFYTKHLDLENLEKSIYGIPEIFRDKIKKTSLVANPGCYPTASVLGIYPFLPFINETAPIIIDAKSGVSGAGKKFSKNTHFANINENIFAYNPIIHRHSIEIEEKLNLLGGKKFNTIFVPQLLPVTRGMLVNIYATLNEEIEALEILNGFYKDEFFIRIKNTPVDIKSVSGTHFCDIYATKKDKTLFVSVAIDNLLRGASSQAVANANLMFGLNEETSLPKIAYVP
jgi:N-acetyl-gamma-glutamyl-phosphate reductase